jgi:TM2 domain-containing membrane protein YozV
MSDEWQGSTSSPDAGWYPDPGGSGSERYWDGTRWTDQTRAAGSHTAASTFGEPMPSEPAPSFPPSPPYQQQQPAYQPGYVSAKSPGLAIFLTILWLGAGHFYAGQSDAKPIILVVANFVLWALFLFCLIGILGWIPLVIWASIDARSAAIDFNRRHGLQA